MKQINHRIFNSNLKLPPKTVFIITISLLLMLFTMQDASAIENNMQQQKITGTILDSETRESLIGVSIIIEGSTQGTITDVNGNYSIVVPNQNSILVFSYIGYKSEKRNVLKHQIIDVLLTPDVLNLKGVVVTAMGIKREKKALTYSSQQIGSEDISKNNLNFVNSLSGKAAGVDIRQGNSGAGGSTKITLRGTKSIFSSSQPLFVIDGVPMVNMQTSDPSGFWGGHDNGDGLSNLNPDDIESINVLKGANAASLYGSQGANGVIIITTKKGVKGKTKVEISSGTSFQSVSILPQLQNTYGATTEGSDRSWGAKGSYENPTKAFFKTGIDLLNSVSISGGNDITTVYFSYANSNTQGIMPTNKMNKNNLTFSSQSKFFKNFTVSTNVMLTDQSINNKVLNGYYWNPLTGLYLFPRGGSGKDISYYKENYQVWDPSRYMNVQNWYYTDSQGMQQNPWWILNDNTNTEKTKRVLASLSLEYKLTDALTIQARGNYDYSTQIFEQQIHAGPVFALAALNGRWVYSNTASSQLYGDLILTYNKDFGNFDLHGVLGTSYQKRVLGDGVSIDSNTGSGNGLNYPNLFTLNNLQLFTVVRDTISNKTYNVSTFNGVLNSVMSGRDVKESVFASFSAGYKKMIYLDIAARQEWSSTLAYSPKNNYIFPSFGLSALINEMVTLPKAISFAKLRASYSFVGREVPPFLMGDMIAYTYSENKKTDLDTKGLTPEMQRSLELGAEMRFFDNRLGFDATYYNIDNRKVPVKIMLPVGFSEYQYKYVNAGGITNKGVEISLTVVPVKTENFTWKSDINYAKNINKIEELFPDIKSENTPLAGGGDGYDQYLNVGGSIGDIYVNGFKRDVKGNVVLGSDNIPLRASAEVFVGNANPDFTCGWNNTFIYKNVSLSFLIDGKFGGKFVDMSEAWFDSYGVSKRSADARDVGYVEVSGVTKSGVIVDKAHVIPQDYYTKIGGRGNLTEQYVYDATNIRLRNVALTYNISLRKYNIWFENASVSLTGQNLIFFYRKAPFDPDNTISTGQLGGVGNQSVESFNLPPTRTFGFNIKLNF
jgi:TonB-linked SusC/RagA family outer membrane protein